MGEIIESWATEQTERAVEILEKNFKDYERQKAKETKKKVNRILKKGKKPAISKTDSAKSETDSEESETDSSSESERDDPFTCEKGVEHRKKVEKALASDDRKKLFERDVLHALRHMPEDFPSCLGVCHMLVRIENTYYNEKALKGIIKPKRLLALRKIAEVTTEEEVFNRANHLLQERTRKQERRIVALKKKARRNLAYPTLVEEEYNSVLQLHNYPTLREIAFTALAAGAFKRARFIAELFPWMKHWFVRQNSVRRISENFELLVEDRFNDTPLKIEGVTHETRDKLNIAIDYRNAEKAQVAPAIWFEEQYEKLTVPEQKAAKKWDNKGRDPSTKGLEIELEHILETAETIWKEVENCKTKPLIKFIQKNRKELKENPVILAEKGKLKTQEVKEGEKAIPQPPPWKGKSGEKTQAKRRRKNPFNR